MKLKICLLATLMTSNLYAQEPFLPKEACKDSSNEASCRNNSHAITAVSGAGAVTQGVHAYRAVKEADTVIAQGTITKFSGEATPISDKLREDVLRNVQKDAKVTLSYNLNPADNKELHISNGIDRINSLKQDIIDHENNAESARNRTRSVYKTVIETHTDKDGHTTTSSREVYDGEVADPDYYTEEQELKAAKKIRQKTLPQAHQQLDKTKKTPASQLQLLTVTDDLEVKDAEASDLKKFLADMKARDRKLLKFGEVTGPAVRAARKLNKKALIQSGVAAAALAAGTYEAYSGTGGAQVQKITDDVLEKVNVEQ